MNTAFFNGKFVPGHEIRISPDDRGFLFADGIYEVMKWYSGSFYDIESHTARLKRSLREIRLEWLEKETFPEIATELIRRNGLDDKQAMIYIQVTRGEAPRSHAFPDPPVPPTVYAFAKELPAADKSHLKGVNVLLKEDIRWSRCDIKSVSLLPNVMGFQEARQGGYNECVFVRDGLITEGSHSNIFFVKNGELRTHPESNYILSGITRKNVVRISAEEGIKLSEVPINESELAFIDEAFLTNTTGEVIPVTGISGRVVGNGSPGIITCRIRQKFLSETSEMKR
jgi:D-alanine transaminase